MHAVITGDCDCRVFATIEMEGLSVGADVCGVYW